jgi:ATP-dependent DNA helicase RecG
VGSHDQPLSPGEVIELAKRADRIMFDDQICRQATLEHISEEKVRWFLRKAKGERNLDVDPQISLEEALEKLGLIIDGKLTNAVVLMFGKAPQRYFVQSEVRCARFKGTKAVKPFIDMKVMDGAVYEQIDQAEKFVLFNMKKAAWVEPGKIERQEKWEYPPEAIREAITNAVAHRDYFSSGNVQIRIFDDRIEVWNPGCLPEGLTVEKLKGKHESKPRNKLIARMFFLIKYIRAMGYRHQ